ncbi:endonuclease MutS2 [bacterium]|nr:endonuclease MutS2 [bacterium]
MSTSNRIPLYNDHALKVLEFDRVRSIIASLARSDEGRSRISETIPSHDVAAVRSRLSEVGELLDALRFDDPFPSVDLVDIRNIFPYLKIEGYNLGVEAIAAVAGNLEVAGAVKSYFIDREAKYPRAAAMTRDMSPHEDIVRDVRRMITPDLKIADDATPGLASIRRRLNRALNALRNLVEKTLEGLPDDVVSERVVTLRNGRFVLPIRDSMKNRVPGAVQDRSQTGRTLFIEPLVSIEANNEVRELELAEQAEIERILILLSGRIASAADDVTHNQEVLVRIDTIAAMARFGVMVDGVVPVINDSPELTVRKGRHPLLEWKFRGNDSPSVVVPLDLEMGGSTVTLVITGPNAGGKTVALKTAGLLTVMALAGMPIPAGEGTAVFAPGGVFADIGDEQSIEDDLSTFSSHMKNIVTILREAGPGSLVLLDELGGATNPVDGEAIALAVLKKLTAVGAITLATTHHGGLKVFAHETAGVKNASMEFDKENLMPTFVLRMGIPGSSYAFEIAARLGMPGDVLRDAESLAGGERKSLEGLIAEMEDHVRRADDERRLAEKARIKAESVKRDYELKLEQFNTRKQELLSEAITESQAIVVDANRSIESAIREIKEHKASHESILAAKSTVSEKTEEIRKAAAKLPKRREKMKHRPIDGLTVGQAVWVDSFGADASVEEVLDGGKKARIRVGKSKASLVVNARDLSLSDTPPEKPKQVVAVNVHASGIESSEIDLRGKVFDDARAELEIFLDHLHMAGMETAQIIHGKGSGALRIKIGAWLEKHPYVESQRLGNWNEGSFGVTVVTLKK